MCMDLNLRSVLKIIRKMPNFHLFLSWQNPSECLSLVLDSESKYVNYGLNFKMAKMYLIFWILCGIILLGKGFLWPKVHYFLVHSSGTYRSNSCTMYILQGKRYKPKKFWKAIKNNNFGEKRRFSPISCPQKASGGGRGRKFKSFHSDQENGRLQSPVFPLFIEIIRTFGCEFFCFFALECARKSAQKYVGT